MFDYRSVGGWWFDFLFVNFHPETWQNDSQVDVRIFFQMGWFNHQLVFVAPSKKMGGKW